MPTLRRIQKTIAAQNMSFPPVYFSHVICNVDSADHVSLIVLVDKATQTALAQVVAQLELSLIKQGIELRPRSQQEPFHSTLGVVNNSYPVDQVVERINNEVTQWNSNPISIYHYLMEIPLRRFTTVNSTL